MIYIAQNTGIPVPKALACYTYGPIDRDPGDYGGLYDTYIFMSLIDGYIGSVDHGPVADHYLSTSLDKGMVSMYTYIGHFSLTTSSL